MPRRSSVAFLSHSGEPKRQMLGVVRSRVLSWAPRVWKGKRPCPQLSGPWALFRRVQMQVLPEGSQNPLQRREEAGDEAKVPALRGEDGYVSSRSKLVCAALNLVQGHSVGLGQANISPPLAGSWQSLCNCPVSPEGAGATVWKRVWKEGHCPVLREQPLPVHPC